MSSATHEALELHVAGGNAVVALNRPNARNALNGLAIDELTTVLRALALDETVRVVTIRGSGKAFCAGADLDWLNGMTEREPEQNVLNEQALAVLFHTLYTLTKPTLACVHGPAIGAGVGLVACCDIAIASVEALFTLAEARLGLVPAAVAPYVVEAIGARHARRYFLSAERFTATDAAAMGLVHVVVPAADLQGRADEFVSALLRAGPRAQFESKRLIQEVSHQDIGEALIARIADRSAAICASPEAREGVTAFLAKRSPAWVPTRACA